MKIVHVSELKEGDVLAKPVTDSFGRPILQENIELTDRLIKQVTKFKLNQVFIKDSFSEGIESEQIINDELRFQSIEQIHSAFHTFTDYENQSQLVLNQSMKQVNETISQLTSVIKNNDDMLTIMADIVNYDYYLYNHSLNVAIYTLVLAKELNYDEQKMTEIGIGALLHDIGKMKIPVELVNKPTKLTELEYEVIKEHTTYGYDLLSHIPNMTSAIKRSAYEHHERLDGSGYPNGLVDEEIHEYAKVIAVSDVFDAVTTDRSYRDAYLPQIGLEILYVGSGTQFKQEYIELFRKIISIYPNGTRVHLSDGRVGIVAKQNQYLSDRPLIRIIEEEGYELPENKLYEIDLAKQLNITIVGAQLSKK